MAILTLVHTSMDPHVPISSHLDVTTEGEVLSEGVTFEPVVCEDPAQVGVIGEEDTKHVPHLHNDMLTGQATCPSTHLPPHLPLSPASWRH